TLNLNDQGTTTAETYTITTTTVDRSGAATITYGTIEALTLRGGGGANTFNVPSTPSGTAVTIQGGGGTNTLVGSDSANTWDIAGKDAGRRTGAMIAGAVSFSSVQNLTGGAGADTFRLEAGQGITGNLDGGGGTNTLDESAFITDVVVNLRTSSATGVGGTVAHIQDVTGGSGPGHNILVG